MKPRLLFGAEGWPCGIHEIASQVVRLGLADALIRPLGDEKSDEDFLQRLDGYRPHVVGLRIESGRSDAVRRRIESIRRRRETTIILGGPTATSHPGEVLEATGADYVFAGDAEESVALFLRLARKPRSIDYVAEIPGLAYSWAGRTMVNLPEEDPIRGRAAPHVSEKTLRENRLDWSLLEDYALPLDSLYLTGGRGCPGNCTFCCRLHGRAVRTKTERQIVEELRGADALVRAGKLRLSVWPLYEAVDDPAFAPLSVSWCSVFDEDFFLDRNRAVRFLQLFEFYGYGKRYRLSFQTNPVSLLDAEGRPDRELFYWIGRVKAMIQLGAESFHPELLRRWRKRHTPRQLETVLSALDRTGQDYNVFQILTDYDSTLPELRETVRLLLDAAYRHPRMRIASSPFMIPLYDTDVRRELAWRGRLRVRGYTDYETPHPEWMDPAVVALADRLDEALQDALYPARREDALLRVEEILAWPF